MAQLNELVKNQVFFHILHVCGIDLLRNPYTSREALIAARASGTAGAALLRPPVVLWNTSGAFAHPNKIYLSLTHVHTPLGKL